MSDQIIQKKIKRNILLNPGPATTSQTVKEALVVSDICPRESEFGELLKSTRKKIVDVVFGQETHEGLLLGCSGTGAVEACLSSCVDDNNGILILENGAYGKRMGQICDAYHIKNTVLKCEWGQPINLDFVRTFLKTNSTNFRVLAFVHHETTTGILNPLDSLYKLANEFNLKTMVDAMSSYAGIPIHLQETPVDYLIASSNKCLHGMAGLGIVITKKSELEEIALFKKRNFYLNLSLNFQSQILQKQFAFTPPVQILYSLNQALDEFFIQGGVQARNQKYHSLYNILAQGMNKMGFIPLVNPSMHSKILTTYLAPKSANYSFEKMHDYLLKKNITIYPGKVLELNTFRISNIGELDKEDITYFLEVLNLYLTQEGISLKEIDNHNEDKNILYPNHKVSFNRPINTF